jgi:hypothetical protein
MKKYCIVETQSILQLYDKFNLCVRAYIKTKTTVIIYQDWFDSTTVKITQVVERQCMAYL